MGSELLQVLLYPGQQVLIITQTLFERADNKLISSIRINFQLPAVEAQKNITREKRHSLVAVHESMITDQRFKQCGGHLRQVFVITGLWTKQSALQQAFVSYACRTAKLVDQPFMYGNRLVQRQELDGASWQDGDPVPRSN